MKSFTMRLPIIEQILAVLAHDLPKTLRYHGFQHTNDVLSETVLFAVHDKIDERHVELLSIAAAYHDAGYIDRYADNEEIGAAMAADAMRGAGGYSASEIHEVEEMIMSTQLIHQPEAITRVERTSLSGYLMDADLGSFGRDDF